jgi:hypothetical protein
MCKKKKCEQTYSAGAIMTAFSPKDSFRMPSNAVRVRAKGEGYITNTFIPTAYHRPYTDLRYEGCLTITRAVKLLSMDQMRESRNRGNKERQDYET